MTLARRGFQFVAAALFFVGAAQAQVIDRLELLPEAGGETEVVIWLVQRIAVQSYNPKESGRVIRLYLQFLEAGANPLSPVREVARSPGQGSVPRFIVSYPEVDGALSIAFDASVSFRIGQTRPRGISIFIRTPPGKEKSSKAPELRVPGTPPGAAFSTAEPRAVPGIPDVRVPPKVAAQPAPPRLQTAEPRQVPGIPDEVYAPKPPAVARKPAAPAADVIAATPPPPSAPTAVPPPSGISTEDLLRGDAGGLIVVPRDSGPSPPASAQAAPVPGDLGSALDRAKQESASAVDPFAAVPLARVEEVGKELLVGGKAAMDRQQYDEAIRDLSRLLNLPQNSSSREGLELIGLAREKTGEVAKARAEYELFLRLYPEDEAAPRVRARLAGLPAGDTKVAVDALGRTTRPDDQPWKITGGLSQGYYSGNSKIEILTPPPPGLITIGQQTLSFQDQKALITNLDFTARARYDGIDTRIVARESYTNNYLQNQSDIPRITSAYMEQSDSAALWQYRLGRQSGTFGLIGIFDGAYAGKGFGKDYRVNVALGEPVQFISTEVSRTVGGFSIEKVPQLGAPGGSLYYVRQTADNYIDRQAIGTDLRYFNAKLSAFALYDYDVSFRERNIFTTQANYRLDTGTNFHFLGDWRKAPLLLLTNALPAVQGPPPELAPSFTVQQALINGGLTVEELRDIAKSITAESQLINLGVNHPFNDKWQVGLDANWSSISGTQGGGSVPPQPSSGMSKTYTLQLIGNNVIAENNVDVANVTFIDAPTYTGRNYSFNHVSQVFDRRLRIDLGVRFYYQDDRLTDTNLNPSTTRRTSPALRYSYRFLPTVSVEGEFGNETSRQIDTLGNETKTKRRYFYVGYRWDWI